MIAWSAHLSTLFAEVPAEERPAAAAAAGFRFAETWWPPLPDPDGWVRRMVAAGLVASSVNADGGDLAAGERGYCNVRARRGEAVEAARAAARVAVAADGGCVNLLVGRRRPDVPLRDDLAVGAETVSEAADAVAALGARIVIEHLNPVDVDQPLLPTPQAAAEFVELVGHPAVSVLFDAYHCAAAGCDVTAEVRALGSRIGHVQYADYPGRGAPGTGHNSLARLVAALEEVGYVGRIGLEYLPDGPTEVSLASLPGLTATGDDR